MTIQFETDELLVNTTTAKNQFGPSIALLAGGGFVVTWYSTEDTDPVSSDIRARIYSADGTPVGNDFIVNTTTTGEQEWSSVTGLADGRFVVTWSSYEGGQYDIRARIYNADGTPAGSDFVVNTTIAGGQYVSNITELAGAGFVVTWYGKEDGISIGNDIWGRIYNANGVPVGNDFRINTTTTGEQTVPSITGLGDGRFVVTWSSYEGGTLNDIRARIYNGDGTPAGNEFIVNTTSDGGQALPSITALSDDRFVVAWESWEDGTASLDIRARIYNADGTPTGDDFVVNTTTIADQRAPSITAMDGGRFAVSWFSYPDGSSNDIRARIYNADGTPAGGDFVVNTMTGGQVDPDITALGGGGLVVTWQSGNGVHNDIHAVILKFTTTAATLTLQNAAKALVENTDTTFRVKVADIVVTDDGVGTNYLALSGADAALFEIFDGDLYLKSGTVLDYEGGNTTLDVTVAVDDPEVEGAPDSLQSLSIQITDVNENFITNGNRGGQITGTARDDVIDGQGGNDTINAGAGNDTVIGGTGLDKVNAGDGDDTIIATIGDGLDVYSGGAGADTLDMSGIPAPATINLALSFASSAQTAFDSLSSIENAIGGSGNDTITGNGAANRLDGRGGDDIIEAGGGNDIVMGGTGNDTMNGGAGNDIFVFATGFGSDEILQFDANPAGGQDLLDISAFGLTAATFSARVTISYSGGNTLVTIDGDPGQSIRLVGISTAASRDGNGTSITQSDFIL
ncbi:MAG: hypothetical protein AB7E84_05435 [Xanthobacteraceae bacterium]